MIEILAALGNLSIKLAPIAIDYITGKIRDKEEVKASCIAEVEAFFDDLSGLRGRVNADDIAAIQEQLKKK